MSIINHVNMSYVFVYYIGHLYLTDASGDHRLLVHMVNF